MLFDENIFQDERCCIEKVKRMIAAAQRERRDKQPELPLIRLRVTYSGPWANVPVRCCLYVDT
jgi:hypothetical protein